MDSDLECAAAAMVLAVDLNEETRIWNVKRDLVGLTDETRKEIYLG